MQELFFSIIRAFLRFSSEKALYLNPKRFIFMKRTLLAFITTLLFLSAQAQDRSVFQFLNLPSAAHAAALGGDNISISDDDPMLTFHNPALLSNVTGGTLSLGYMSYLQGSNKAGAAYNMDLTERSSMALGVQYLGFGTMKQTDAQGTEMGTFSAKDMALMGTYSYALSDYWSGGVTGKVIYSNYDVVYSLALGVDLGLNYYDPESDLSFSLLARQLGGQVLSYDEMHEPLPFNLLAGMSKRLAYAPVRFSLTLTDLNHWSPDDFYNSSDASFKDILFKHFILGVDLFPTEYTWISAGYNHLLHSELMTPGKRSLAGFSLGAGINVSRINIGVSYGRYHVVANSLTMNISYTL